MTKNVIKSSSVSKRNNIHTFKPCSKKPAVLNPSIKIVEKSCAQRTPTELNCLGSNESYNESHYILVKFDDNGSVDENYSPGIMPISICLSMAVKTVLIVIYDYRQLPAFICQTLLEHMYW